MGKRFEPGNNANPGGRPKGIARYVREKAGGNGELLIDLLFTALSGKLPDGVDAQGNLKTVDVSVPDRIGAAKILLDRGFGKAPQFAPIEDGDPLDLTELDMEEAAAALDKRLDELAERRNRASRPAPRSRPRAKPAATRPRPKAS